MDPLSIGEREEVPARFIFGPLGNGYRLSRRQRRIVEIIGVALLIPAVPLIVLAKLKIIPFTYGFAGFAGALVAAFIAMKVYVSAAGVPYVTRPLAEKLLANSDHAPLFLIYLLPILIGLMMASVGFDAVTRSGAWDPVEWLLLLGLLAFLLGSLALGYWIKRKLAERRYEALE